jgi:hypothetical protein
MATRFLHEMKFFEQLWKPFTQGSIMPSLVEIGLVVFHKIFFKFTIKSIEHTYIQAYIHTYIHTHTHTHIGESLYATASQMLRLHYKKKQCIVSVHVNFLPWNLTKKSKSRADNSKMKTATLIYSV